MSIGKFLAFDFGAESARAVTGILENKRLFLEEVHRFPTKMLQIDNHIYWNVYRFYEEMIKSLIICVNQEQFEPESIAVDTWGVDFGFLAKDKTLVRIPYSYRDPQVSEAMAKFHQVFPPEKIYQLTGISMESFNSIYQIYAMRNSNDEAFRSAKHLMFMPDLLNFFLCGVKNSEFTIATTTQLYNPAKGDWEDELLTAAGIDRSFMNEIVYPGTQIGMLDNMICRQTGIKSSKIIAVCSHDTGSAIVAVPAINDDWAYISSGTWSLMGIETSKPLITSKTFEYNFTNEGGAAGTFRFLKNIMGMWLLQQCRKSWSKNELSISYTELIEMGRLAEPFKAFIDPDYKGFYNPDDMPSAIDDYCQLTSQIAPGSIGEYVRTVLESLAFKYRCVLDQLVEVTGRKINKIHIIGGGTQNKLLCQFTANATALKVIAGPAEGTAAGNLLIQAMSLGYLKSLEEIREVIRNSFSFNTYIPENTAEWNRAYTSFRKTIDTKII